MKNAVLAILAIALVVGVGVGVYLATSITQQTAPTAPVKAQLPDTVAQPVAPPATAASDSLVRVYGVVTNASTGDPVEGAQIRLRRERRNGDEEPREPEEATSDASGVFEVRVEPDAYDSILCIASGFTRQRAAFAPGSKAEYRVDFQMVQGGTITGTVTDKETGAGIEDVRLEAVGAQENFMERMRSRGNDPGRRARTEADGTYVLDGVPEGSYRIALSARNTGYLSKQEDAVTLDIKPGVTYDNINFALERGAEITGRVVDESNAGVADARVMAMPSQMIQRAMRSMTSGLASDFGPDETRTDATGAFTLRGIEFDSDYRLLANADGYARGASDDVSVARGSATPPVTITLTRGVTVSGAAHFDGGAPAPGEQVFLIPESGGAWTMMAGPITTRTNDDGTFTFEHVGNNTYWLRHESDLGGGMFGGGRDRSKPVQFEVDGSRDIANLDLIIVKRGPKAPENAGQGVIDGTVLLPDGKPAEGVRVEARQVGNPGRSYGAQTGPDGTFQLAEMQGPVYDLSVTSEFGIAKQPTVPVGTTVKLTLTPPASLSGHVVDGAGEPVVGCKVQLTNSDDAGKISSFVSVMENMFGARSGGQSTDASGFFEFAALAPGSYTVRAESASRGTAESDPMSVAAGQDVTGVQLILSPGVSVGGIVVGPASEPIRGASVQLAPLTQDAAANLVAEFIPSGMLKPAGSSTTNDSGEFTMNNVPPGTYRLVVSHSDYAKSVQTNFSVEPNRDITGFRVTLGKGGQARGTFMLDGKPQANAMIAIMGESGIELVQTDSQGRFEVSGLMTGPHMIAAFDPSRIAANGQGLQFNPQVIDIAEGQASDISIGGAGSTEVTGTVTGDHGSLTIVALRKPDGTPLENLDLTNFANLLDSFRGLGGQTVLGPDGTFTLDNVEPGSYIVEVYSMDFDEANPDIGALLNLPRTPIYRQPIEIGATPEPIQIELPAP